ncbi:MAG: DUF2634 domain-containing protein [Plectolyngbya sp. WJT66-NPBG17]|jgi:phage gp46-like protein|nr:DUF2634 domain-containing protein [Plectolyngbya sp. WJT66-NPBG17]MBW4528275.1 DUF2634 domain-containing protein [Phormidium tanganyikae FI6-MK23]
MTDSILHSFDIELTSGALGQTGRGLATVQGRDNLAQAILNRLNTRRGELKTLGHSEYGSRLYLLMGEINNDRTRKLAEFYLRESLAQESRIAQIQSISIEPPSRSADKRDKLIMTLVIQPIDDRAMTLSLEVEL